MEDFNGSEIKNQIFFMTKKRRKRVIYDFQFEKWKPKIWKLPASFFSQKYKIILLKLLPHIKILKKKK